MNDYQISCYGKTRFPDRKTAKKRATQIRKTGHNKARLHPYPCDYGDHWHLGHRPGHATYLRDTPSGPAPLHQLIQEDAA